MCEDCDHEMLVWWSHEDYAFFADVPDLPDCAFKGYTRIEAVNNAERAIRLRTKNSTFGFNRGALRTGGRAKRKFMERTPATRAALQNHAFARRSIRIEGL